MIGCELGEVYRDGIGFKTNLGLPDGFLRRGGAEILEIDIPVAVDSSGTQVSAMTLENLFHQMSAALADVVGQSNMHSGDQPLEVQYCFEDAKMALVCNQDVVHLRLLSPRRG
jgi:hypothetical protein